VLAQVQRVEPKPPIFLLPRFTEIFWQVRHGGLLQLYCLHQTSLCAGQSGDDRPKSGMVPINASVSPCRLMALVPMPVPGQARSAYGAKFVVPPSMSR
jgi:hypothetical protein